MRVSENLWLYLSTFGGSWGDGMWIARYLRLMKRDELSVVYYAEVDYVARQNAMLLAHEGLVDDVVFLPKIVSTEDIILSLRESFSRLKFNRLITNCVDNIDLVSLWEYSGVFSDDCQIYALYEGGKYAKEYALPITNYRLEAVIPYFWDACSPSEDVDKIWALGVDSTRPTVCLMPQSTRPYGTLYKNGVKALLDRITPIYNVIILGVERGLNGRGVFVKANSSRIGAMREEGVFDNCVDAIGLGPIKQIEILKRADVSIITPTGALVLPEMYRRPFVIVNGGDYALDGFLPYGHAHVEQTECLCPMYPCTAGADDKTRQECIDELPRCFDTELNVDGIVEAIEKVLKT